MSRLFCRCWFSFRQPLSRSRSRYTTRMLGARAQFDSPVPECMEIESRHLFTCSPEADTTCYLLPASKRKPCWGRRNFSSNARALSLNPKKTFLGVCNQHSVSERNLMKQATQDWRELSTDEKAEKFQRPKAQSTIDEEEVSKFSSLSALWWDEGGEFEALHSLNELRVPLIRNGLASTKTLDKYNVTKPLDGFWIVDVGSGGGILSEPLARLGASVIGLEASEENIKIAQAHLIHDPMIREHVKYVHSTVEDLAVEQAGKFDAVVASEVLEHVADAETFVTSACQLVKPGGSIFFTTLNKTALSYGLGIVVAERILRLVSPGTHDWSKFITPRDLQFMLSKNNFSTRLVHGMWYNPLTKRWTWAKDTSINYAVHAVRAEEEAGDTVEGKDTTMHSEPSEKSQAEVQS